MMTPLTSRLESDLTPFATRRQLILAAMEAEGGGALLLPTAQEQRRNRDTHYPFRFDSDFYYLTGFTEPDAWLLLRTYAEPRAILFCRPRDREAEKWDGRRLGPEEAVEALGVDAAYPLSELATRVPELLMGAANLWVPLLECDAVDSLLRQWKTALAAKSRQGVSPPYAWLDARALIARYRLIKDPHEVACMRISAAIAAEVHCAAMRAARPGVSEAALEGVILATFRARGAEGPSYPTIVAGGANACILHYVDNRAVIPDGALVLIDAGCEYHGYASDITRTFPVNGRFSGPQRALYEVVRAAQEAAIAATRPGAPFSAAHDAATRVIVEGLLSLGLLAGDPETIVAEKRHQRFFPHRTGHWLGLDVHDVGPYQVAGEPVVLQPGMVTTIEPGLYIDPADDIPRDFWGIGIRIEDDALVTATGCELLTRGVPVAIDEIEALMRS
ncbi:aminopeptidase P N-terminal domain-containing protein [Hydrogenophilus islandicus]